MSKLKLLESRMVDLSEEVDRLRAENARLREWLRVALGVYDDCDTGDIYDRVNVETFEALRAALKEGGGE